MNVQFLVINKNVSPLLGLQDCVKFRLLSRSVHFVSDQGLNNKIERDEFVKKHKVVFEGLGVFLSEYTNKIHENALGVIKPLRRVPQTVLKKLKCELAKLEKNQIFERVEQPKEWSSNLVIVQKQDKSLGLCLDSKELNKVFKRDYLLIPTLNDTRIRSKLVDKRYFTVLDIKKSFWHIKLDPKSADLCIFSSPLGYFKFLRLPFT